MDRRQPSAQNSPARHDVGSSSAAAADANFGGTGVLKHVLAAAVVDVLRQPGVDAPPGIAAGDRKGRQPLLPKRASATWRNRKPLLADGVEKARHGVVCAWSSASCAQTEAKRLTGLPRCLRLVDHSELLLFVDHAVLDREEIAAGSCETSRASSWASMPSLGSLSNIFSARKRSSVRRSSPNCAVGLHIVAICDLPPPRRGKIHQIEERLPLVVGPARCRKGDAHRVLAWRQGIAADAVCLDVIDGAEVAGVRGARKLRRLSGEEVLFERLLVSAPRFGPPLAASDRAVRAWSRRSPGPICRG